MCLRHFAALTGQHKYWNLQYSKNHDTEGVIDYIWVITNRDYAFNVGSVIAA